MCATTHNFNISNAYIVVIYSACLVLIYRVMCIDSSLVSIKIP